MILPLLKYLSTKRIVLASGSPRRKSILENMGLTVDIIPSQFDENLSEDKYPLVSDFTIETARGKALEVLDRLRSEGGELPEVIIGADTVVAMDNRIYGKPGTEQAAGEMLSKLSGQSHQVFTGVVLLWKTEGESGAEPDVDAFYEMTKVKMATLTDEIISAYIKTGEPLDKAGSYGIQGLGGSLVEGIEGDYFNVMGFPLHHFCKRVSQHYSDRLKQCEPR